MSEDKEQFKARYSNSEIGWLEHTDRSGIYKIINVPTTMGLRWGDMVRISDDGSIAIVSEVVERMLENGAMILYKSLEAWPQIAAGFEARYKKGIDYAISGCLPPDGGKEGFALINYTDDVEMTLILRDIPGTRFITEDEILEMRNKEEYD